MLLIFFSRTGEGGSFCVFVIAALARLARSRRMGGDGDGWCSRDEGGEQQECDDDEKRITHRKRGGEGRASLKKRRRHHYTKRKEEEEERRKINRAAATKGMEEEKGREKEAAFSQGAPPPPPRSLPLSPTQSPTSLAFFALVTTSNSPHARGEERDGMKSTLAFFTKYTHGWDRMFSFFFRNAILDTCSFPASLWRK